MAFIPVEVEVSHVTNVSKPAVMLTELGRLIFSKAISKEIPEDAEYFRPLADPTNRQVLLYPLTASEVKDTSKVLKVVRTEKTGTVATTFAPALRKFALPPVELAYDCAKAGNQKFDADWYSFAPDKKTPARKCISFVLPINPEKREKRKIVRKAKAKAVAVAAAVAPDVTVDVDDIAA